jgi:tryptophanyl-tRNA synthetase
MTPPAFTPRVFSGIQPSGGLTLGNYLGALKRFVTMQDEGTYETIYCMVDLHAITVWQDPEKLAHATRELCAGFIASGIDPERSILFNQSQVPEHAQLAWIFNCVARMGWMGRMTQWKDKAGKNSGKTPRSASSPTRRSWRPTSSSTTRPTCPWARIRSSIWS